MTMAFFRFFQKINDDLSNFALAVRFARSTGLLLARQVEELLSAMMAPLDQSQGDLDWLHDSL